MILAIGNINGVSKYSEQIMEWLYLEYSVKGWEEHLLNEPLLNLISESGFIDLEVNLEYREDITINLPRDLRFVADPKFKPKSAFDILAETINNPVK